MAIALQLTIMCDSSPGNSFDGKWYAEKCVEASSEHKRAIKHISWVHQLKPKKDPASAGSYLVKLTVRSLLATEPTEYYRATGAIRSPLHCRASSKYQRCSS